MYHDESTVKDSFLNTLAKFTLSRYYDNIINTPFKSKPIGFFQII